MSKEELERVNKETTSQLKPLYDSINEIDTTSQNFKIFRQNLSELLPRIEKIKRIFDYMAQHVKALDEGPPTVAESGVTNFFDDAFFYLGVVEIGGNLLADLVITYLIATGHDFHVECAYRTPRIKHIIHLKELEEERVPLAVKLNFIQDCGITVLKLIIDTRLRNDIAHMNFDIKDNTVYIRGKPAVDIISNSLLKMSTALETHHSLMKKARLDLNARVKLTKKQV